MYVSEPTYNSGLGGRKISKTLLAITGIILGWGLKSLSDYVSSRRANNLIYNQSIFYIFRLWKHLKDYERATEHFRSKKPDVGEFEKWRAILAAQLSNNFTHDQSSTIEAVRILSQVDPVLATRLENSIRRLELSFRTEFAEIASNDPERYAQLIYNQDHIIDITLSDFRKAANKLSARVSIIQQIKTYRYFCSIEKGTKEFNEGMEEQAEMLQKVVAP